MPSTEDGYDIQNKSANITIYYNDYIGLDNFGKEDGLWSGMKDSNWT